MKSALFTNFSAEEFIGYWDGKPKKFAPGQSMYMPDYLAQHFAKHLTNRELLRRDGNGNEIIVGGDRMTSPKRPADVPQYMELFNKAYKADDEVIESEKQDEVDMHIAVINKNKAAKEKKGKKKEEDVQIVEMPDDEE